MKIGKIIFSNGVWNPYFELCVNDNSTTGGAEGDSEIYVRNIE